MALLVAALCGAANGAAGTAHPSFVVSIARAALASNGLYLTGPRRWVGRAAGVDPAYSVAAGLIAYDHPGPGFESKALYVVRPDGTGMRRVSGDAGWFPSWSPDGTQIATVCHFGRHNDGHDVCVTDLASGTVRTLVRYRPPRGGGLSLDDIAWSPDGATLAIAMSIKPRTLSVYVTWPSKVVLYDLRTRRSRFLASSSDLAEGLAWSGDSQHIAYWQKRPACSIVVQALNAGASHSITVKRCATVTEGSIFLSADGKGVYYALQSAFEWTPFDGAPRHRVARVPHVLDGGSDIISG